MFLLIPMCIWYDNDNDNDDNEKNFIGKQH